MRDYGTGQWTGGDEACDHRHETKHQIQGATSQRAGRTNTEEQRNENYRDTCGRCGAQRVDSQLGLESTPQEYVTNMVALFREVRRVLRDDGSLWLNLGDTYAHSTTNTPEWRSSLDDGPPRERYAGNVGERLHGLKPKDLCGIPWRVAFALQEDGWVLRSEIIWSKPNPMPESVTDRPTKAHEQLFLFSKATWVGAERPLPMREADAAWLAALIDGEGTICFQERENRETANHIGIRLSIVNTNTALLARVQEIIGYGGTDTPSPRYRSDGIEGRPIYSWQVTNAKAASVIAAVRPYLIAKRTQAELALACHALNQRHTGRGAKNSQGDLDAKRRLAKACSDLNHGRDVDLAWFTPPKSGRWVPNSYMYDADAIREPHRWQDPEQLATNAQARQGARLAERRANGDDSARRTQDSWNAAMRGERDKGRDNDRGFESEFAASPAGRNRRSVWTIPTQPFPEAHFATYPEELVRPCILAGTSEKGECVECGAPWTRQVERQPLILKEPAVPISERRGDAVNDKRTALSGTQLVAASAKTIGWVPSCSCNGHHEQYEAVPGTDATPPIMRWRYIPTVPLDQHPVRPQLVLDPFIGSGTTSLGARKHGRRSIGIDLSTEYLAIAAKRTQQLSLLGGPEPTPRLEAKRGLTGGAYSPPGQSPHSNARDGDAA